MPRNSSGITWLNGQVLTATELTALDQSKVNATNGTIDPATNLTGGASGYSTLGAIAGATASAVSSTANLTAATTNLSETGEVFTGHVTGATSGDVSNAKTGNSNAPTIASLANIAGVSVSGTYGWTPGSAVDYMGVGLHYRADINAAWLIYNSTVGDETVPAPETTGVALALQSSVVAKNSQVAPAALASTATLSDVINSFNNMIELLTDAGVLSNG